MSDAAPAPVSTFDVDRFCLETGELPAVAANDAPAPAMGVPAPFYGRTRVDVDGTIYAVIVDEESVEVFDSTWLVARADFDGERIRWDEGFDMTRAQVWAFDEAVWALVAG